MGARNAGLWSVQRIVQAPCCQCMPKPVDGRLTAPESRGSLTFVPGIVLPVGIAAGITSRAGRLRNSYDGSMLAVTALVGQLRNCTAHTTSDTATSSAHSRLVLDK